jgi:hypothetical protein
MAEKVKIYVTKGKIEDFIEVYPVDAKELTKSGEYSYVDAEDAPVSEKKSPKKPAKKSKAKAKPKAEEKTEPVVAEMTDEELAAYVADKGLEIEGFEDMNLVDKRTAVTEAEEI